LGHESHCKKTLIGNSFSASVYSAVTSLLSGVALLLLNRKQLKNINSDYFKIAVPTGGALGLAALSQTLAYNFNASPTNQAFLDNLSCVVVPIILFLVIKKKPTVLTISASMICLLSSMVLSGVFSEGMAFHTADILNALAGVLYGVNIAFTGIYAKKFVASIYVMIQMFVQAILSFLMAVAFNYIHIGSDVIDAFVFTFDFWLILALVGVGVISSAMCWTIRTSAMKYVSPNVVAIIMPFSSVITGIVAIIIGQDKLTSSLIIGAALGMTASFMSASSNIREKKKEEKIAKKANA
jgi:drug/metabolite transporter (DMT)-like permease